MTTVPQSTRSRQAQVGWRRLDGSPNVPQIISDVGIVLAAIAFGTPFFIINGGLSVSGLGLFVLSFGRPGETAWGVLNIWQMALPHIQGLPNSQPVLPWLGVVAATICQVMAAWMRRTGVPISQRLAIATVILSIYDFGTTLSGTAGVAWIARYGWIAQVPVSLVVTFAFELAVAALLAALSNAARRE